MKTDTLIELIERLRGKNGCPWDRKQTPQTMAVYLIEETYELIDAIESGNPNNVCEELGDVLFQIFFIAGLFQEMGHFDIKDVVRLNIEKMIRRHPHVFGSDKAESAHEVKKLWHNVKLKEKNHSQKESILDSVPVNLPALMRAYSISDRAAAAGFDWDDISGVMKKVKEEWSEFKTELTRKNQAEENQADLAMEFGDILFTLVNVARFAYIHPETALSSSIKKFEKRFKHMEKAASEDGKSVKSLSRDEMNKLWEEAKKNDTPVKKPASKD